MLYCENCMALVYENQCPSCGTKKLREAKENDPVYLITKDAILSASIEDILNQNEIPCQKRGILGEGIISRLGYTFETYHFFVPFGAYKKSKELLYNFFENEDKDEEFQEP